MQYFEILKNEILTCPQRQQHQQQCCRQDDSRLVHVQFLNPFGPSVWEFNAALKSQWHNVQWSWLKPNPAECDARTHGHLLLPTLLAAAMERWGCVQGLYRDAAETRGNKTEVEGETDGLTHRERQEVKISHPSLTSIRATTNRSLKHEDRVSFVF